MTPETAAAARAHLNAIELYQEGLDAIESRIAEVDQEKLSGERAALSFNNGRTVAMESVLSTEETVALLDYFKKMILAKKAVHDEALAAL